MYDYIIVGSGLMGSVLAYRAKQQGKKCLVLEKRTHVGGNVYLENIQGINVHKYGPHIFHTNNKEVWEFVSRFITLNRFTNSPLAYYKGRLYNLPFNMNTFHQLWGVITPNEAKTIINEQSYVKEINNLEDQAINLVGRDIYNILIKGYTEKQWGRSCKELPPFIIKRLPLRFVYDNNYFNDSYQGVGDYNELITQLLAGTEVITGIDYLEDRNQFQSEKVIYTGPIDAYFDYKLGRLEYRTVKFETKVIPTSNFQGNAVINYTDSEIPFTRIIEHKHFEVFGDAVYDNPNTVISKEFSCEWRPGLEPYYPINNERNNALFEAYNQLAKSEKNVIFTGRLAEYKYYNMDQIIEKALCLKLL